MSTPNYDFKWGASAWGLEAFAPTDVAAFRRVAEQIVTLPFPQRPSVIEVFASMGESDHEVALTSARRMKPIADDLGLTIHACGFNPFYLDANTKVPSPHLTSSDTAERGQAIRRIGCGLEYAAALAEPGKGVLMGPWHTRHGHLYPVTSNEQMRLIDILKRDIAPYAQEQGVIAALEPLRAHEQCLVMPGYEAICIVGAVGSPYIALNGDTVHWAAQAEGPLTMSIENLVRSEKCAVLHLSEHDRREWGTGDIGARTRELMTVVKRAGYTGPVVMENFCPGLHQVLNIHRPNKNRGNVTKTPYEVLYDGAQYITDALGKD